VAKTEWKRWDFRYRWCESFARTDVRGKT